MLISSFLFSMFLNLASIIIDNQHNNQWMIWTNPISSQIISREHFLPSYCYCFYLFELFWSTSMESATILALVFMENKKIFQVLELKNVGCYKCFFFNWLKISISLNVSSISQFSAATYESVFIIMLTIMMKRSGGFSRRWFSPTEMGLNFNGNSQVNVLTGVSDQTKTLTTWSWLC